jgi:hypothetical protein
MPGTTRLALACALVATAACAAEPTRPTSSPRTPTAGPSLDVSTNPDGTCKSGFTVANGRCEPI